MSLYLEARVVRTGRVAVDGRLLSSSTTITMTVIAACNCFSMLLAARTAIINLLVKLFMIRSISRLTSRCLSRKGSSTGCNVVRSASLIGKDGGTGWIDVVAAWCLSLDATGIGVQWVLKKERVADG